MPMTLPRLLRHLHVLEVEVLGVQPVAHPGPPAQRLALRDLVLVVREQVVDAAAVDVEVVAEQGACSWPSTRCASPGAPAANSLTPVLQLGSPASVGFQSVKSAGWFLRDDVLFDAPAGAHLLLVELVARELRRSGA